MESLHSAKRDETQLGQREPRGQSGRWRPLMALACLIKGWVRSVVSFSSAGSRAAALEAGSSPVGLGSRGVNRWIAGGPFDAAIEVVSRSRAGREIHRSWRRPEHQEVGARRCRDVSVRIVETPRTA